MPSGKATFRGEEITAQFSANAVQSDYGVPRSPTWIQFEDFEVETLEVLGVTVDVSKLPVDLQEAIYALADDLEFEQEEQYYE